MFIYFDRVCKSSYTNHSKGNKVRCARFRQFLKIEEQVESVSQLRADKEEESTQTMLISETEIIITYSLGKLVIKLTLLCNVWYL